MKNLSVNQVTRVLFLPVCGGLSLGVGLASMAWNNDKYFRSDMFEISFLIGMILSALIGWPILAIIHWKFSRYSLRYIAGGVLCSTALWLILDGRIRPGEWHEWIDPSFWSSAYGLRPLSFFSIVGLAAGTLYTGAVAVINKYVPPSRSGGQV